MKKIIIAGSWFIEQILGVVGINVLGTGKKDVALMAKYAGSSGVSCMEMMILLPATWWKTRREGR